MEITPDEQREIGVVQLDQFQVRELEIADRQLGPIRQRDAGNETITDPSGTMAADLPATSSPGDSDGYL